jgi:hypothetical protein
MFILPALFNFFSPKNEVCRLCRLTYFLREIFEDVCIIVFFSPKLHFSLSPLWSSINTRFFICLTIYFDFFKQYSRHSRKKDLFKQTIFT